MQSATPPCRASLRIARHELLPRQRAVVVPVKSGKQRGGSLERGWDVVRVPLGDLLRLARLHPLDVVQGLHDDGHLVQVDQAIVVDVVKLERPVKLFCSCKYA